MDFSFEARKDGRVAIFHRRRQARVLKGAEAGRFLDAVQGADPETQQLWMARVTRNFKRGNERTSAGTASTKRSAD